MYIACLTSLFSYFSGDYLHLNVYLRTSFKEQEFGLDNIGSVVACWACESLFEQVAGFLVPLAFQNMYFWKKTHLNKTMVFFKHSILSPKSAEKS